MASLFPKESPPHFLQDRMLDRLMDLKDGKFNKVRNKIWELRNGGQARPAMPDPAWIISQLDPEEKELLISFIRKGKVVPADIPNSGSMPTPRVEDVYGRVMEGETIRDLGTGNGARASNSRNLVGYDNVIRKAADLEIEIKNVSEYKTDFDPTTETATSFNSLCAVGMDRKLVEGHNGIHVFPDVEAMAKAGFSRKLEDGTYETKVKGNVYNDVALSYGTSFMPFYKSKAWFRETQVTLTAVGKAMGSGSLSIHGKRAMGSIGDYAAYPATYKYNGIHAVLEVNNKEGRLEMEGGTQIIYSVDGTSSFNIDLEIMKNGVAYVTRVSRCGNIVPHHSLEVIIEFLHRTDISITSMGLRAPQEVDHSQLAKLYAKGQVDGIVARSYSTDYLIKYQQSVDVPRYVNWGKYIDAADEAGYQVYPPSMEPTCDGPICEYVLTPHKDGYRLVHERCRVKKRTDAPRDMINLLGHPTINGNPHGPRGRSKTTDEDGKEVK